MQLNDSSIDDLIAQLKATKSAGVPPAPPRPPLNNGGGGGTSGGMEAPMKDYVDTAIAGAEARVDSEFSKLRVDMSRLATKGTTWGAVGTGTAILLAALAFGGDRFDAGLGMADQRVAQLERDQAQDATAKETSRKLDELLKRIPPKP